MQRWTITIEVWPYSTGAGSAADQRLVGKRVQQFVVQGVADSEDALRAAEGIAQGIKTNPAVWMAPITGIVQEAPQPIGPSCGNEAQVGDECA